MRNVLAKAPKSAQKIMFAEINKVPTTHELINRYQDTWPSAIGRFQEELEECLVHLFVTLGAPEGFSEHQPDPSGFPKKGSSGSR